MKTKSFISSRPPTRRWMIVDDNADVLCTMQAVAEFFTPAAVECFSSPAAAWRRFQAAPDAFELIITDFDMPEMNGAELRDKMVALLPSLKILLATGSHRVAEGGVGAGFSGILRKPFSLARFREVLLAAGFDSSLKHELI